MQKVQECAQLPPRVRSASEPRNHMRTGAAARAGACRRYTARNITGEDRMAANPRDIVRNNVKEKLARNEVVASMTVRLVRGIEIARIAQAAGFDSFYVDVEHSNFSIETTSQICIAGLEAGITPLVRVPTGRPEHVTRVLEGGALGVIVPHVRSADEARRVVGAAMFAPLGNRSPLGGLPHLHYRSFPVQEATRAMNDATMVVVMME